jgi:hypothetical protein
MFIKRFAKDNNVIYVNTCERLIKSKHVVNLSLYIKRRILESYSCYVKLFLIAI